MATVIFYNFILLSSTFFVWLSGKGRTKIARWVLLGVAFLLVFIPAAIRYDIGVDYLSYLEIYEDTWRVPLDSYKYKEPAFYFINWFLRSVDAHFQWLFVVFSFVFTAVAFKAYPKRNAWLIHFLFFSMLWFFSFNALRQAVALSFCMLAIFNYFDKRYFLFFLLTIVGSFFHQTALFITVSGALALIPFKDSIKKQVAPVVFIGIIMFSFVSMSSVLLYIEQLLNFTGLTNYANYFNSSKHFIVVDFGTGLATLAKLVFSIYILLNAKALLQLSSQYWLLLLLVLFYGVSLVLANSIVIFARVADVFVIGVIVAAYLVYQLPSNVRRNRLVLIVFLSFLLLLFIKRSVGIETSYSNPKLNPYQTVFARESK